MILGQIVMSNWYRQRGIYWLDLGSEFLLFGYIMEVLVLLVCDPLSTSTSDFTGKYFKRLHKAKNAITCITVLIKLVAIS